MGKRYMLQMLLRRSEASCKEPNGGGLLYPAFLFVYWVSVAALSSELFLSGAIANLFVFITYAALFCVVCLSTIQICLVTHDRTRAGVGTVALLLKIVLLSVIGGVFLEACTLFGSPKSSPLSIADWGVRRILLFSGFSFAAFSIALRVSVNKIACKASNKSDGLKHINVRRGGILLAALCLTAVVVGGGLGLLLGLESIPVVLFVGAVLLALFCIWGTQSLTNGIEWAFLSIALPFGLLLCTQTPAMTGVSWDDQIHYRNALELSYLTAPELTHTEVDMADMAVHRAEGKDVGIDLYLWDSDHVSQYEEEQNEAYLADVSGGRILEYYVPNQMLSFTSIGYLPSAIGLWIGRLLHLPFTFMVVLGRVFNLLSYCTACFFAIRITPIKKLLFMVVALIPMNIFLASNYAYDPWLVSFLMLGVALLFREMWGKDGTLDRDGLLLAGLVLFAGLCVKAVYFPIIGLFFLMPKSKFSSSKQRMAYYTGVVAFGLFVLASFAMPFLFSVGAGEASGDIRGGSDVDSGGQLRYILSNPLEFANMLREYLVGSYLNPAYATGYTLSFSYLSNSSFGPLLYSPAVNYSPVIFLVVVAFFDNDEGVAWRFASPAASIWATIIYLASLVLVATALYISFTPVGHDTVNGCQSRYQLPVILPTLAIALNYHKPMGMSLGARRAVACLALAGIAFSTYFFVIAKWVAL